MKKLLIVALISIGFISCKKENNKSCWQIIDTAGNELQIECEKTESEIKTMCGGDCSFENFNTNRTCRFYYKKK
jgi:hypothetical protein